MSEEMSPAQEVAEMMARARAAQAQIANYTQEQVDELVADSPLPVRGGCEQDTAAAA